ncbi:methyl-accepting chemotaxis protein, partial [Azospirillum argentinense]
INATVSQMDEMTQKNAALVEETTAAAQAMAGQANDLKGLIGFFKLDPRAVPVAVASTAAPPRHVAPVARPAAPASRPTRAAAKPAARAVAHSGAALKRNVSEDDDWKEF